MFLPGKSILNIPALLKKIARFRIIGIVFATVTYLLFILFFVHPVFLTTNTTADRERVDVQDYEKSISGKIVDRNPRELAKPFSKNPFLNIYAVPTYSYNDNKYRIVGIDIEYRIKYDTVIASAGVVLIIVLSLYFSGHSIRNGAESSDLESSLARMVADSQGIENEIQTAGGTQSGSAGKHGGSARSLLAVDARIAFEVADGILSRASFVLVAGILLSFSGIFIFYLTAPHWQDFLIEPPYSPIDTPSPPERKFDYVPYLLGNIRPTAMLIFVEALAWFLLRQYRLLIDDYRSFYRIYIKRANYLAAISVLDGAEASSPKLLVGGALLQEDAWGKLRNDETSENLEARKLSIGESNLVFDFFKDLYKVTINSRRSAISTSENETG